MKDIKKRVFGFDKDGNECYLYTIKNEEIELSVLDKGGIIQSLKVKDRKGKEKDIVLGYDNVFDYQRQNGYVGAIIGRNSNRLDGSRFLLNGEEFNVSANEGENQLHGGLVGFDKKIWKITEMENGLQLAIFSKNMEEGYPGNLQVKVNYILDHNKFIIEYMAYSDEDTVCNLTQHSYFNLSGHKTANLDDHKVQIFADFYNPTNEENIPIGSEAVNDTPFDFRKEKKLTADMKDNHLQLIKARGYDHNFIINNYNEEENICAIVKSESTGIVMKQYTDMPGVQLYTANFLPAHVDGKGGATYQGHGALCLETQYVPNAMNDDRYVKPILLREQWKKWTTSFEFDIE